MLLSTGAPHELMKIEQSECSTVDHDVNILPTNSNKCDSNSGLFMSDTDQKIDEKKGNDVLAKMLKTPPSKNTGKRNVAPDGSKDSEGVPRDC